MRKHRAKFALHFKDGVEIQTMKDLREHFDIKRMIEYFKNDKLSDWLLDRLYEKEAEELNNISLDDKDFAEKLCAIFSVDFDEVSEQLDDPETIAWRNERRARLRKITSDKTILKQIDNVAFTQEDLEDIILDEVLPPKIYLCGERFIFPSGILNKKNIDYVGVGSNVMVEIDSHEIVDFDALNVTFKNIFFNDAYKKLLKQEEKKNNPVDDPPQNSGFVAETSATQDEPNHELLNNNPSEEIIEEESYEDISGYFEKTTTIKNSTGVHAMPATKLVNTANKFKSQIVISAKGKRVNVKKMLEIMSLGLLKGTEVTIIADGIDAKRAVDTLVELIDNKFGED